MLMIKISTDIGAPVMLASNMDIPVTPPSMNLLDNRNPFKPMPADNMPNNTNTRFFSSLLSFMYQI